MKTIITSQICSQGSYGLTNINPANGIRRDPDIMRVWHVHDMDRRSTVPGEHGQHRVGSYLSRKEARQARADYASTVARVRRAAR